MNARNKELRIIDNKLKQTSGFFVNDKKKQYLKTLYYLYNHPNVITNNQKEIIEALLYYSCFSDVVCWVRVSYIYEKILYYLFDDIQAVVKDIRHIIRLDLAIFNRLDIIETEP